MGIIGRSERSERGKVKMGILGRSERWESGEVAYWAGKSGKWKIRVIRIGRVRETTGGSMVEVTDWSVLEVIDGNLGR